MATTSFLRRARPRVVVVSLVAVGALSLFPTAVQAESGAMTAVEGLFTGTSGNDQLVIGGNFEYLTHNRFDAGDPGFASAMDFDSTVEGVQTRLARIADQFSFDGLGGDDTLTITSGVNERSLKAFDLGPGTDQINASAMSNSIRIGFGATQHMETLEKVIGSNYPDVIYGYASGAPRSTPFAVYAGGGADTIQGTNGADRLDGAGGTNNISGMEGDDVLYVAAPLPPAETDINGGGGNDALVVSGSNSSEELGVWGITGEFWAWNLSDADGGYHAVDVERTQLNLLAGDDTAFVTAAMRTVVVAGGPGQDDVLLDALGSTAMVETVNGVRKVTIPLPYGNATVPPVVARLDSKVEHFYLANETTIATAPAAGAGPHVRTFRPDGTPLASFFAYDASFTGGVNIALGDVNGDGDDDIVTAPESAGGPHVRVFYSDGTDTGAGFFADDPAFAGGVSVAAVDVDGNGIDEIVTARASNAPVPWVRVWNIDGVLLAQWPANGLGATGIEVARGPYTANGEAIIVSSGAGAASYTAVFNGDGSLAQGFPAYSPYGGFGGGVTATRGVFRNHDSAFASDGYDDIVTGAGPGGGPLVRVVERSANLATFTTLSSFYAYTPSFTGGVEVATCNADGGPDEIVTAPGRGAAPLIRTFNADGSTKRKGFLAYGAAVTTGVHVACGETMSRWY